MLWKNFILHRWKESADMCIERLMNTILEELTNIFIPFIKPNQKGKLSSREKNDILPMHNQGMCAIPQILTNSAEDFIKTAERLGGIRV